MKQRVKVCFRLLFGYLKEREDLRYNRAERDPRVK